MRENKDDSVAIMVALLVPVGVVENEVIALAENVRVPYKLSVPNDVKEL